MRTDGLFWFSGTNFPPQRRTNVVALNTLLQQFPMVIVLGFVTD
jgi:hypothetical protein